MGIFSRLMNFFRIRTSAVLDKAEDPGQVMDYSYGKQLEQLQQLRRSIADVVTQEKRLEMQQSQLLEKSNKIDTQAQQALLAGREDLARAVLTGLDYPQLLLPLMLDRFRSDRRLTAARLGLVKGCINRHRRRAGGFQPEFTMGLDENSNEPGYLLGRLFAVYEQIQTAALGRNVNATIKDKFYGAAAALRY